MKILGDVTGAKKAAGASADSTASSTDDGEGDEDL